MQFPQNRQTRLVEKKGTSSPLLIFLSIQSSHHSGRPSFFWDSAGTWRILMGLDDLSDEKKCCIKVCGFLASDLLVLGWGSLETWKPLEIILTTERWWQLKHFYNFNIIFTSNLGEIRKFDYHIFQMGWFNHQLDLRFFVIPMDHSWISLKVCKFCNWSHKRFLHGRKNMNFTRFFLTPINRSYCIPIYHCFLMPIFLQPKRKCSLEVADVVWVGWSFSSSWQPAFFGVKAPAESSGVLEICGRGAGCCFC